MLNYIKDAFIQRVKSLSWMDEVTKKATLEKNKEMMSFIGFPDWLFHKDSIETYYENVIFVDFYLFKCNFGCVLGDYQKRHLFR